MKRFMSTLLASALVSGAFTALPAGAQEAPAPEIPAEVLVEDPVGDANFVNDGTTNGVHSALPDPGGNHVTGQDASGVGDLLKVWMSTDAQNVSVHFLTEDPPPIANGVGYSLFVAPGEGEAGSNASGCLRFVGIIPGSNPGGGSYQGPPWIKLHDRCNVGGSVFDAQDGEFSVAAVGDEGVTTFTFPRSYSPLLADGTVLSGAYAQAHSPLVGADGAGFLTPSTDDTVLGADYTVASGGKVKPKPKPKPKPSTPVKKKNKKCKNLKGKARKNCLKKQKKNKTKSCKPYAAPERSADVETVTVTDKATAEAPLEVTVATHEGIGMGRNPATFGALVSHAFQNVQVDSKAKSAGLYMRVEFPDYNDYDLYLDRADGTTAAQAAGFSDAEALQDGDTSDGHTEIGAEQVTGIKTADCGGYTADIVGATTQGGDVTVKLWLGEATYDPNQKEG